MINESWQPKIRGWWNIDVEAYKLILQLAQERFNDVAEENISITDKSQKILILTLSITGFFVPFFSDKHITDNFVFFIVGIAFCVFVWNIYLLWSLLTSKGVYRKGLSPSLSFRDDLDSPENEDGNIKNQLQLTFFNAICVLESSIEQQRNLNNKRIYTFNYCILSICIYLIIVSILVAIILNRS